MLKEVFLQTDYGVCVLSNMLEKSAMLLSLNLTYSKGLYLINTGERLTWEAVESDWAAFSKLCSSQLGEK